MHVVALGPVLVVPMGQSMQVRSVVFVGGSATIWPLGQSVQVVQAEALTVFEKVPVSQALQALSIVELPIVAR